MGYVIKRDGVKVAFHPRKIEVAITKAIIATYGKTDDDLIKRLVDIIVKRCESLMTEVTNITVEDIQGIVEDVLMRNDSEVARNYIEYRHDRDIARSKKSELIKDIDGLIQQTNKHILNENANKDSCIIPTMRDLLAGIASKDYAQKFMLPIDIVEAHKSGDIHFHDMDYSPLFPMFNCMLIDIDGMLTNGFRMGNAEIETPKSISTACAITAQIIAQVASHIYGGTTINGIDEILAPYVTKSYEKHLNTAKLYSIENPENYASERTEKECYDAFQALEYEINTLHTANGQTPFVTLGFGLGLSWESYLIQKSILQVRIDGLGKHKRTAIFPKLVFAIKDGINHKKTDPRYTVKKLALKCAALRMYPDILNYDKVVEVTGSFKYPMGCRSFLAPYTDPVKGVVHAGRNNLGVVSINLPRIAIEAQSDEKKFWDTLKSRLEVCYRALMLRVDRLRHVKANVAPILYCEGACGVRLKPDEEIFKIFENGRASVSLGYIGIHEMCNAMYPKEPHILESKKKQDFAEDVMRYLRYTVDQWKEDTGLGFSLYGTPAENLCGKFCRLDKEKFGVTPGVTDKDYYTNSFHLDVAKKVDPYTKIDFEAKFLPFSSGGFISYGEFPNMARNLDALEDVWDYSYNRIPYYGTNTPVDNCYECGYKGEFNCTSKGFECPQCGNHNPKKCAVIRRVCGYLGAPNARPFNAGKQEEVKRRVKHLEE